MADRWNEINSLFLRTLDKEPAERSVFLAQACGGDAELRQRVDTLLASHAQAGQFLEQPLVDVAARLAPGTPAYSPGSRFGSYTIELLLGAGGMGAVYKATDTRLNRTVALKILAGPHSRQTASRLRREARALASLNHPNICTIYDVRDECIVFEYVEGQLLRELIPPDGMALDAVLRYGVQIADALDHAHVRGLVHCDLKSANIMITPANRVKVLDFGLAKLAASQLAATSESADSLDDLHVIAGTPAYMAPEVLRGRGADARSDLWSFGILLYEALTAVPPFAGPTTLELAAAILERDAPPLPPRVPESLRGVIQRCLMKDPERRYQRAVEVRGILESIHGDPIVVTGTKRRLESVDHRRSARRITSVAVLPLVNVSSDPEQDYFADGITDALITDLAQIRRLTVISRMSSMRYKGTQKTIQTIAQELSVRGLIGGSVHRVGERVRITTELIDAARDTCVWAKSYERHVTDVIGLQAELARAIAEEIRSQLTPEERRRLSTVRAVHPNAYEAYLRGRYYWSKVTEVGFTRALEYLRTAVELDPTFALAQAALADVYIALGAFGSLRPQEAFSNASAAALKALEVDRKLGEAYRALALVKMHEWDWRGAEASFRAAMRWKPGSAETHWQYAVYLVARGRCAEAVQEASRARTLDPLSVMINNDLAFALSTARRHMDAIEQYQRTLELEPNFVEALRELGLMYAQMEDFDAAVAQLQKASALARDSETLAFLGYTLALAGQRSAAEAILNELDEMSKIRYVSPVANALIHIGLGEHDRAFESLHDAYEERSAWLIYLRSWPVFDPLRSDIRFAHLLQRIGLVD